MSVKFSNLSGHNLIVDEVYEGGKNGNAGDDPISKLFPKLGVMRGFRKALRNDRSNKPAYVILYTSMEEIEWPDYLDKETGVFRYYGDNRTAGNELNKKPGNKLLEETFKILNSGENLYELPPFFVFRKTGNGRDVQFLGLAAPGNPTISPDKDLVAFWRTINNKRFQNYESYFTILDTRNETISKEWLYALLNDHDNNLKYAPNVWREFIAKGRNGIKALKAPRIFEVPNKYEQLQCSEDGKLCLEEIRKHYMDNPTGFEACAVRIVEMMDNHFESLVKLRGKCTGLLFLEFHK